MGWNNIDSSYLGIVEAYAEEQGWIASEEELSERFDTEVMPTLIEDYGKKGIEFNDQDIINESFNNWTDVLCSGGSIHPVQYDKYCYVGKYSEDGSAGWIS